MERLPLEAGAAGRALERKPVVWLQGEKPLEGVCCSLGQSRALSLMWLLMWNKWRLAVGTNAQPVLALMSLGWSLRPH